MSTPEHVARQLDLEGQPVPPAEVAKPNPTHITIAVEIDIDMPADDCWPDGEPATWGVEDLAAAIRTEHPHLDDFIREWNIAELGGTVTIHDGRGAWASVNLR